MAQAAKGLPGFIEGVFAHAGPTFIRRARRGLSLDEVSTLEAAAEALEAMARSSDQACSTPTRLLSGNGRVNEIRPGPTSSATASRSFSVPWKPAWPRPSSRPRSCLRPGIVRPRRGGQGTDQGPSGLAARLWRVEAYPMVIEKLRLPRRDAGPAARSATGRRRGCRRGAEPHLPGRRISSRASRWSRRTAGGALAGRRTGSERVDRGEASRSSRWSKGTGPRCAGSTRKGSRRATRPSRPRSRIGRTGTDCTGRDAASSREIQKPRRSSAGPRCRAPRRGGSMPASPGKACTSRTRGAAVASGALCWKL